MIARVDVLTELERYRVELVSMYMACFAEPPWNEIFTEEEIWAWFVEMMSFQRKIVLVYEINGKAVGSTFNFPVANKIDVLEFLPREYSPEETCYLAEMFVDPGLRRQGIAKKLHEERLRIATAMGFVAAIQRTNFNSKMFPLIMKTGFKVVGRQEVLSSKKIGGVVAEAVDLRAISLKHL